MNIEDLSGPEIAKLLEDAHYARKVMTEGRFAEAFRTVCNSILEREMRRFVFKVKPDDVVEVVRAQETIKKYRYAIFQEIDDLIKAAQYIEEQQEEAGLRRPIT